MTKEELLEGFEWIPKDFDLTPFFERDPTLSDEPSYWSEDPEIYALIREARLLALEILFIKINKLTERLEKSEKNEYKLMFFNLNLIDALGESDPEKLAHLLVDQRVNAMDPDFSFQKAIEKKCGGGDHC